MYSNDSIVALLDAALVGDSDALEELLVHVSKQLYVLIPQRASALGLRLSPSDIEDLNHNILLLLLHDDCRRLRSFGRRSSLTTWLRTVVTNALIDATRSRTFRNDRRTMSLHQALSDDPEAQTLEEVLPDDGPTAPDVLEYRARIEAIREAKMACLGEEERLIIDLWSAHRTENEIAALMDMNPNTVATKIRRAKAKILAFVNEHCGDIVIEDVGDLPPAKSGIVLGAMNEQP